MIPHFFIRHRYCYLTVSISLCSLIKSLLLCPLSQPDHIPRYSLSIATQPSIWEMVHFTLLVSAITPWCVISSEDLLWGASHKREHNMLPFWVTSLNKIFSVSFHLLAKFMILFFFKAEYFCTVYVYYIFTINLLDEGNVSCFPFWAIVNRIAMDITVKLWSRM